MGSSLEKVSKFLSYILRHEPDSIGLTLDQDGWISVDCLIAQANQDGQPLTRKLIEDVVANSDKKRFTFSENGKEIRAAQGHSTTQVSMNYVEQEPPAILYHGTAKQFLASINTQGLIAGSRHYVHLSADEQTAISVGQRHGKVVVLIVQAQQMWRQGYKFYRADNGVWLTNHVPALFLSELPSQ